MAGNQAGEHEIQERLDRMERELRRWRLGTVSLTVPVVAAGGLAEPAKRLSVAHVLGMVTAFTPRSARRNSRVTVLILYQN